ncbi:UNVERIFIED_CONTAM: hypothetical protein Slati_2236400 [Sesamum latifolium]|uniref:Reverse transcriptase domain-containing protein n=1 Tax=Sesamum latifolium TaxID=2727402 RepID=A0AAW2WTF3_9LAMI
MSSTPDEVGPSRLAEGKEIVIYNAFDALLLDDENADSSARVLSGAAPLLWTHVECGHLECPRPEPERSSGPGSRIWLAWDDDFVGIDVLDVDAQYVHCRLVGHLAELIDASLNARTSDHSPLVLRGNAPFQIVSMFRFDNYLTLSSDFTPSVHRVWQHHIVGTAIFAVTRKLKALKPIFRAQRQKKGDLSTNVRLAATFLDTAQSLLARDRLCPLILHLEFCFKLILGLATKLEQHMLQQWVKLAWKKGGDQCSWIFFRKTLLGGEGRVRLIDLCYLRPWARHIINEDESIQMTSAWPVIGKEVTQAIPDFFTTGRLLKQVNATLLSLIPKVQNPTLVAEFWPISCCNVLYKVITKIIVQRLSGVLDDLISPSQNAFVPGRSIGDNILLAQELFQGYNQQHVPPRCALKVDIRKAYDTVEWDFLSAVLKLFGFPPLFVSWIEECVTSPSYSVCLNGSPHGFSEEQGDCSRETYVPIPICPYHGGPQPYSAANH